MHVASATVSHAMKLPSDWKKAPALEYWPSAPHGAISYLKLPGGVAVYTVPYMYAAMNHGNGMNDGVTGGVPVAVGVCDAVVVGVVYSEFEDVDDGATVPVAVRVAVAVAVVVAVADDEGVVVDDRVDEGVDAAEPDAVAVPVVLPVGAAVVIVTVCTAPAPSVAEPSTAPLTLSSCTTAPARAEPLSPAAGR